MTLLLLLACDAAKPDEGVVDLGALTAQADSTIPTVYAVSWENSHEGVERFVEYGRSGEGFDRRTNSLPGSAGKVIGLTGGQSWDLRAVVIGEDGVRGESDVLTVEVAPPPSGLPRFLLQSADPDRQPNLQGLHFVSIIQDGNAWLAAVDENGDYAWWLESENNRDIDALHTSADGTGLLYTHFGLSGADTGIGHIQFDGTGASYTPAPEGHHDALEAADGTLYYISAELSEDTVIEGGETRDVSTDTIMRIPPGTTESELMFSFPDDYPHSPYRTCGHFDKEKAGGGYDFSHTNSVMLDEDAGQLLFMSKNLDSLTAIDVDSGDFLWQIGGRWSDYTDVAGDDPPDDDGAWKVDGANLTWWSHGHMSDYWHDGMLVFDNGYHHFEMSSRVVEYRIDHEARTIEKVQEWASPSGTFSPVLGDARRLPNGHRLLAFMLEGRLLEVTPEGETVWDIGLELGAGIGRITHVPDIYAGQPGPE